MSDESVSTRVIQSERNREKITWKGYVYVFDKPSADGVSTIKLFELFKQGPVYREVTDSVLIIDDQILAL